MSESNDAVSAVASADEELQSTPAPKPPSSWAALLRSKQTAATAAASVTAPSSTANGIVSSKPATLSDILRSYDVGHENKTSFIEPRGLVNTGNMCYMNSVSYLPYLQASGEIDSCG